MNPEELLPDSYRRTADLAVHAIEGNQLLFEEVFKFALSDDGPVAMRAARVIHMASAKHPELILPHLEYLVDHLHELKTDGVKRSFSRIFIDHYHHLDELHTGKLLDRCFIWLADAKEKVALRAYSLDILYSLSKAFPEIKPELIASIEQIMPESSAALRNHCSKTMAKLYKELDE